MVSDMPGNGIIAVKSLCSLDNMINMATLHNGGDFVHMNTIFEGSTIEFIPGIAGQHLQQWQELRACPLPQLRLRP